VNQWGQRPNRTGVTRGGGKPVGKVGGGVASDIRKGVVRGKEYKRRCRGRVKRDMVIIL